jgi:hypothetical protein
MAPAHPANELAVRSRVRKFCSEAALTGQTRLVEYCANGAFPRFIGELRSSRLSSFQFGRPTKKIMEGYAQT